MQLANKTKLLFFQAAEMNTITKEIITEIYTFIDQHHIKLPKKKFQNKDDIIQFDDTFSLDTRSNDENDRDTKQFTISANVL